MENTLSNLIINILRRPDMFLCLESEKLGYSVNYTDYALQGDGSIPNYGKFDTCTTFIWYSIEPIYDCFPLQRQGERLDMLGEEQKSRQIQTKDQTTENFGSTGKIKNRQQNTDRNLNSNTWKVYFKQLRDSNTETHLNIARIIKKRQLHISVSDFIALMEDKFPADASYISHNSVKKVFRSQKVGSSMKEAIQVLRISMRRFFKYEIFTVNIKSVRTTRKIRDQQINRGKQFLTQLFL